MTIALPSGAALADRDDHHDKDRHDDKDRDRHDHDKDRHDKDHHDYPKEAPPPPKAEKEETKAGNVWVAGRWDWKGGKWEWIGGHLEAEHPGKKWQVGRWEQKGDHYELVEGTWIDAGAAEPPHEVARTDEHRREWKTDRPTVSSYWPSKGKAGQRVVIRGTNFPTNASIVFAGKEVKDVKVSANAIEFRVPADAATGQIGIKMERHVLPVGNFEVANYDADAEAKRIAEEQRKAAEAEWAARQKEIAADKAARQAAYDKAEAEREKTREDRRRQREEEIRKKFEAAFLADADTQAELTLHAQRVAQIERLKQIAELQNDSKMGVRVTVVEKKENDRHEARMAALLEAFKAGGAK